MFISFAYVYYLYVYYLYVIQGLNEEVSNNKSGNASYETSEIL